MYNTHVRMLASLLEERKMFLSTAESCTGGGVASALTELSGASAWFDCGWITYSNESKSALLGVPQSVITTHGAVSEEVAHAMVAGALARSQADVALSVTGIAGPGGAQPGKPVGTVCFGWGDKGAIHVERCHFNGNRQEVRSQVIVHALRGVLRFLAP